MKFDSAQAELGRQQARLNAEARARGDLPPLPKLRDFKAAIREKCVECMGGADPVPMADIRRCAASPDSRAPCPLWHYRPWQ